MKFSILFLLAGAVLPGSSAATVDRSRVAYTFEQNQGQAAQAVKFLARGEGYGLYLTEREAVLTLSRDRKSQQVIRMSLDESRAPRTIEGVDRSQQSSNYFIGNDSKQWKTNVPSFHGVRYANVYDGVDLVYHSAANHLEYDFVLAPRTSADIIKLRFDGMDGLRVTPAGALELSFGVRKLLHQAPVAYQTVNGERRNVSAAYMMLGNNRVGFRVGPHDSSLPLVIDPVVVYSTYLGGSLSDYVRAIAVDQQGNTYVTGETTSGNFPIVGPGLTQIQGALTYGFVTKYNPAGTEILYSALIGGDGSSAGYAIAVDQDGNAFAAGVTGARNFPMVNPVQSNQPGLNIGWIAKLNPQGSAILFSTYIGGERNDAILGIALDQTGNIHVTGRTSSTTFPVANSFQNNLGGSSDAFVAMYSAPNYRMAYSTYLGAASAEEANALTTDNDGNTYVTGFAQGPGMATVGAYQSIVVSPNDVFLCKINASGSKLEWFTYYGGRGDEKANTIALAPGGNILVGGWTTSNNLPITPFALQATLRGDTDAFLAMFNGIGQKLLYGTYLGSTASRTGVYESINQVAVDGQGDVVIAGVSGGADFPTVRPVQAYGGGNSDAFVARIDSSLSTLLFSTHLGGTKDDTLTAMAVDVNGTIHVGGDTLSSDFPLKNAKQTTFSGAREGFVTQICDPFLFATPNPLDFTYQPGRTVPPAQTFQVSACAPIPFQVQVSEGDFLTATPSNSTTNGTITVAVQPTNLQPGLYQGVVKISSADAVESPIEVRVTLRVGTPPSFTAQGVANSATSIAGTVAPGEIVVIYGKDMGPAQIALTELDNQGRVASVLKQTRVYFDGVPAPLVYALASQVSAVVPYGVSGHATTTIVVEYRGLKSDAVTVGVTATAPGIFTANSAGSGQAAMQNSDYSLNNAANPAARGSFVIIYATGEGQTNPGGMDGVVAGASLPKPIAPVSVTIGGQPAQVLYAGAVPGLVSGVLQLNVVVPENIAPGAAELRVKVGNVTSPAGVTVAVK